MVAPARQTECRQRARTGGERERIDASGGYPSSGQEGRMHCSQPTMRIGCPTLAAVGLVVVAIMGLSLVITATGTARFAVSMGYSAHVGYAVGAILDLAKGTLLVAAIALWSRCSF